MKSNKKLYMAITPDKYELPIAIFEHIDEVCSFARRTRNAIWSAITRQDIDRINHCRYISISLEDIEWA